MLIRICVNCLGYQLTGFEQLNLGGVKSYSFLTAEGIGTPNSYTVKESTVLILNIGSWEHPSQCKLTS